MNTPPNYNYVVNPPPPSHSISSNQPPFTQNQHIPTQNVTSGTFLHPAHHPSPNPPSNAHIRHTQGQNQYIGHPQHPPLRTVNHTNTAINANINNNAGGMHMEPRYIASAQNLQGQTINRGQVHTIRREEGFIERNGIPEKPPARSTRMQYIPYETTYTDYEAQQMVYSMWVPVQKKCMNYYTIQNITEYVPREIDDVRVEVVPEEIINMRVQYVPVQRRIIHYPKGEQFVRAEDGGYFIQGNQYVEGEYGQNIGTHVNSGYVSTNRHIVQPELNIPGYQPLPKDRSTLSYSRRTNYVTADNYVPDYLGQQNRSNYKNSQGVDRPRETRFSERDYYDYSPEKRL